MEISKKKLVGSYIAVATVAFIIGALLFYPIATSKLWFVHITETWKEKYPSGHVDIVIFRQDGAIEKYSHDNLVVTIGKRYVRNLLGFNNVTNMNATVYIALSNDASPDASWTKLPNEITGSGLARAEGTATVINSTAYQVQHTFTASATVTVQCTGLHWSSVSNSDGNLFAAATFTQVTLEANDQIQITWTVNLS